MNAMVVPGSGLVKKQAEAEGLDKIFSMLDLNGVIRVVLCVSL